MTSNKYLALLVPLVIVGLGLGTGLLVLIAQWRNGAAFANPLVAILLVAGSYTGGVGLMYLLAVGIERLSRRKEMAARAEAKEEKAARRKRGKKR